jgi:hypothetical protein
MGTFIGRAIQPLARFIRFALQLLTQLLKTRLNFLKLLLCSFGAPLKLFYVLGLRFGASILASCPFLLRHPDECGGGP